MEMHRESGYCWIEGASRQFGTWMSQGSRLFITPQQAIEAWEKCEGPLSDHERAALYRAPKEEGAP